MVWCVDGGDNELVDVVTPLLDCRGRHPGGGGLLSSWCAASNVAPMPATAGGGVVVQVVRWGWLSITTVVASVWPPTHHDRPTLEREVVPLPSLPLASRGMGGGRYGVDVHHGDEAKKPRMTKRNPPYLAC
jgi:hypothetical protein